MPKRVEQRAAIRQAHLYAIGRRGPALLAETLTEGSHALPTAAESGLKSCVEKAGSPAFLMNPSHLRFPTLKLFSPCLSHAALLLSRRDAQLGLSVAPLQGTLLNELLSPAPELPSRHLSHLSSKLTVGKRSTGLKNREDFLVDPLAFLYLGLSGSQLGFVVEAIMAASAKDREIHWILFPRSLVGPMMRVERRTGVAKLTTAFCSFDCLVPSSLPLLGL